MENVITQVVESPVVTQSVRHPVSLGRSRTARNYLDAVLCRRGLRVAHSATGEDLAARDRAPRIHSYTVWEKYGRNSYPRTRNKVTIHSCATIESAGAILRLEVGPLAETYFAPRGYAWCADDNGVKLQSRSRPSDDYHVTADLIDSDDPREAVRECVRGLRANAKLRRDVARREREARRAAKRSVAQERRIVRQAESEGLSVCLADSIRVGNCRAGSIAFATRHKLDATRHYRPSELLAVANGDGRRVALVVAEALRRHGREMARGYCELADHN